jgi:hypothetical protein
MARAMVSVPWKGAELEHADRAVPDDGAGGLELRRPAWRPCGADVQDHVVGGHVGRGLHRGHRVGLELLGADHVGRDRHLGAARLHGVDDGRA